MRINYDAATDSFWYESGDGPDVELAMQSGPAGHCGSQHDPDDGRPGSDEAEHRADPGG